MIKRRPIYSNSRQLLQLYRLNFKEFVELATECYTLQKFKTFLASYVHEQLHAASSDRIGVALSARFWLRLIEHDGEEVSELSTGTFLRIDTIERFWRYLNGEFNADVDPDLWVELYKQMELLHGKVVEMPQENRVRSWMNQWHSGLDDKVVAAREANKERMIGLLIMRIEKRHSENSKYLFTADDTPETKREKVMKWWDSVHFQLSMAIKNPARLNLYLNNTLSKEVLLTLDEAYRKGIPFFITPYYASLLCIDGSFDDATLRAYVLYSQSLVSSYGTIRAWEKEDQIEAGKPNAAGWLLPEGGNVHRRYPEVAILIPDSVGRACGGLCASCQRMYDFQSTRFNFDLESLKPKEGWPKKLERLMRYFEQDTQLRDILITGGDAFMSQNATLRNILDSVLAMAARKRKANALRANGEKVAELQRVRLGTRLPVYLPMRVGDELIEILKQFKERGSRVGIKQFIIQTHFQTPLEITPESKRAVRALLDAGWVVTNQLVYNVAASRRGHTAQLRRELNRLGVLCYYTFTVKGFAENYALFVPNSRSLQESAEEKRLGLMSDEQQDRLLLLTMHGKFSATKLKQFLRNEHLPFVATDRNVLNLPGIGKSMSFKVVGVTKEGKRVLCFEHDKGRRHSPIIEQMPHIYIVENKSIGAYLRQLESIEESAWDYESIWGYTEGETEPRFTLSSYPEFDYQVTEEMSFLGAS